MTKTWLRSVQLHPVVWRILQLLGIFPFQIDPSGRVIRDGRIIALVFCFISAFYLLFYWAAFKAYISNPVMSSFWGIVSTVRIHISVWVLNFSILWNLIQINRQALLLNNLKDSIVDADQIDSSKDRVADKILTTTLRKFIVLCIFDWFINAPLVIYTNTFAFVLWPSIFWACYTFQNFISNVLILYINHLTKLLLYPVQVMTELMKNREIQDYEKCVKLLQLYERLFESIQVFKTIYGPLILLSFAYDFVFIVSQFFLFTYFALNELTLQVGIREILVLLRCVVFITPNCTKLYAVTYTMEEVTIKVSYYFCLIRKKFANYS